MEELSIEEKAKRYDEAIEIAKKNYITAQDLCEGSQIYSECFKNTLENIFPELKWSDDDRIKKWLIAQLEIKLGNDTTLDNMILKAIAYIEKQDEQKPIEWNEEDERKVKDIIYFLNSAKKHYASDVELNDCIKWLWSLIQRMER